MSRDREHLVDILESAKLAVKYVKGKTKKVFLADVQLQDSVIRRLEVIGEAARRVSDEGRDSLVHLPWNSMIGMRNAMIHEYDDIDLEAVWNTTQIDIPPLVNMLENMLNKR